MGSEWGARRFVSQARKGPERTPRADSIPTIPKEVKGAVMNIFVSLGPIAALIAGVLILIVPRLLNYIVALYLIIIGLLGLLGPGAHSLHL
jgi:hypothetical protein